MEIYGVYRGTNCANTSLKGLSVIKPLPACRSCLTSDLNWLVLIDTTDADSKAAKFISTIF